jgi:hypothetical protein
VREGTTQDSLDSDQQIEKEERRRDDQNEPGQDHCFPQSSCQFCQDLCSTRICLGPTRCLSSHVKGSGHIRQQYEGNSTTGRPHPCASGEVPSTRLGKRVDALGSQEEVNGGKKSTRGQCVGGAQSAALRFSGIRNPPKRRASPCTSRSGMGCTPPAPLRGSFGARLAAPAPPPFSRNKGKESRIIHFPSPRQRFRKPWGGAGLTF